MSSDTETIRLSEALAEARMYVDHEAELVEAAKRSHDAALFFRNGAVAATVGVVTEDLMRNALEAIEHVDKTYERLSAAMGRLFKAEQDALLAALALAEANAAVGLAS